MSSTVRFFICSLSLRQENALSFQQSLVSSLNHCTLLLSMQLKQYLLYRNTQISSWIKYTSSTRPTSQRHCCFDILAWQQLTVVSFQQTEERQAYILQMSRASILLTSATTKYQLWKYLPKLRMNSLMGTSCLIRLMMTQHYCMAQPCSMSILLRRFLHFQYISSCMLTFWRKLQQLLHACSSHSFVVSSPWLVQFLGKSIFQSRMVLQVQLVFISKQCSIMRILSLTSG